MNKPRLPLPKKTERVHEDKRRDQLADEKLLEDARDIQREQSAGPRNNEEDDESSLETICCDHCGHEYDRHVGDECPNCGHNNHNQFVEKYGE